MLNAVTRTPVCPPVNAPDLARSTQEAAPDLTAFQGMDLVEKARQTPEYLRAQRDLEIERANYARAMRVPPPPQPKSGIGHLARCLVTGVRVGAAADRMAEWENARYIYGKTLKGAEIALRAAEQAALARLWAERQESPPAAQAAAHERTQPSPQISSDHDTVRIGNVTLPRNPGDGVSRERDR